MRTIPNLRFRIVCGRTPTQRAPSTRPKRAPTRFAAHANGRHCSRRARSAHATPISEIIEMNGTSHRTMSPAPTGPTPAPRASPVARRLRLGDVVSAFCDSIGITRRIVAHLPRPFLPPSAASKLLSLLVALVALATANAATLQGSVGGGYQYTTSGTDTSTQEAFATSVSTASAPGAAGPAAPSTTTPSKPTSIPSPRPTGSHLDRLQDLVRRRRRLHREIRRRSCGESRFQDLNPQNIPTRGTRRRLLELD